MIQGGDLGAGARLVRPGEAYVTSLKGFELVTYSRKHTAMRE
jgi:hypothetical protein